MLRPVVLLGLLAVTGTQGQLVMYFVNALSDMLQRNGLKSLLSPTVGPAQVDENRVDGSGLNGNLLMSLKEQFEKLNKTKYESELTSDKGHYLEPVRTGFNYNRPLSIERRTSEEEGPGGINSPESIARRRFRLIRPLTPKNVSEFGIPPKIENNDDMVESGDLFRRPVPQPTNPRVNLRLGSNSAETSTSDGFRENGRFQVAGGVRRRPVTPRTSPIVPGKPFIRPSPLPRPSATNLPRPVPPRVQPQAPDQGRVVIVPGNNNVRTLPGGGNQPIVIVPQGVGPPGQQPVPRFPAPVPSRGPQFRGPPNPLLGGGPPPSGFNFNPDLSVPFDSRPRPDGSVPVDPREFLNRSPPPPAANETGEDPPNSTDNGVRFRVPPKPLGTGVPPPVAVDGKTGPDGQGPVNSIEPSPPVGPQPRPGPNNGGPPFEVGVGERDPSLRIFNAPFGPSGPAQVLNGPNPNVQQNLIPNPGTPNGFQPPHFNLPPRGQQGPPNGGRVPDGGFGGNGPPNGPNGNQPNDGSQTRNNQGQNVPSENLQLGSNQQPNLEDLRRRQAQLGPNIPGFTPVGNLTDGSMENDEEQPRPPLNDGGDQNGLQGRQPPQGAPGPQGGPGPQGPQIRQGLPQGVPVGPNGQPLLRRFPPNFVPRVGPNGVLLGPNGFPLRRRLPINFQNRPNINQMPLDGNANDVVPQPSVDGGPVPGGDGGPNNPGQDGGPVVSRQPVAGPPPNPNQGPRPNQVNQGQGPNQFNQGQGPNQVPNQVNSGQNPNQLGPNPNQGFPPVQPNGRVAFGPPNGQPPRFRNSPQPPPNFQPIQNGQQPPVPQGFVPRGPPPQGFGPRGPPPQGLTPFTPRSSGPPATGPPGA